MEMIASRTRKHSIGKQYKYLPVEIKEIDFTSRRISGYAAAFGNKDKAKDILIKGCFAKSIQDRGPESPANDKIIFLWMHDMSQPVGKIVKLIEDDRGLYFEAEIDDIELGDRVLKQLESGTLNQFSIGYSYVWDKVEYDDNLDAYIVKEVILYEISVVSIGCNGMTEYLGLKSSEDMEDKYDSLRKDIEGELSSLGIAKKSAIMGLFTKLEALLSFKPDKPLNTIEAGENKRKGLFRDVKFKNNNN